MVLDPLQDFHHVFLKILRTSGKVPVKHRFVKRAVDRDTHSGILARGIIGLVVLRLDGTPFVMELDQRVLPCARDAVSFNMQNRNAVHKNLVSSWWWIGD
jgi:hypothetical protein